MEITEVQSHEDKFASMARQMGQWVDQILGPGYRKFSPRDAWSPAINIYEDEAHYCVVVELAGVSTDQIDLRAEGRALVISGYRKAPVLPVCAGRLRLHHMEIDQGQFVRRLEMPVNVNSESIEASYKSGFLWIKLPKTGGEES